MTGIKETQELFDAIENAAKETTKKRKEANLPLEATKLYKDQQEKDN